MTEETKLKSQMGSDEPVKFTDEELKSLQEFQLNLDKLKLVVLI